MNKNSVRAMAAALVLAAGGAGAIGQVEVVYAIDAHAPGHVKSQVPGMEGITFRNFPRAYRSPNGQRWATVATLNGFAGTQDQALVTGVGMSPAVVAAQEATTLDSDGATFAFFTNVAPRVSNDGQWISTVSAGDKIVRGNLAGVVTVIARSNDTLNAPADVTFGANPFSSASYTALGPSFLAGIGMSPMGANEMAIIAGNAVLSMPVFTVPTDQANGTEFAMSDVETNGFWTDDSGTRWVAQGRLDTVDTTIDRVVVVTGSVKIQEGSTLPGMAAPVSTITTGSAFMEANGDWYCRGSNSDGQGWIVKNGVVIAKTGAPIVPGSSENFSSLIDMRGNGRGDYVVVGRTNNPSTALSDVVVVNGKFVVARESDPVDLDNNGVPQTDMFLHVMPDRVMFADDGYVYFSCRLKPSADATADIVNSANSSSLLRVAGCPADLGRAGGLPGADSFLDNNDFIAFIGYFFNADMRADRGIAGGLPGSDGAFDNNDFIAFINLFFAGC